MSHLMHGSKNVMVKNNADCNMRLYCRIQMKCAHSCFHIQCICNMHCVRRHEGGAEAVKRWLHSRVRNVFHYKITDSLHFAHTAKHHFLRFAKYFKHFV
jgi:hypothetical protein